MTVKSNGIVQRHTSVPKFNSIVFYNREKSAEKRKRSYKVKP